MSDSEEDDPISTNKDRQLKIVIVGDGASGKTSLIMRYSQQQFDKQYRQTVGIDYFQRRITLPGGIDCTMKLWDIGGQTLGGGMLSTYLFNADGVLLVYDVTNFNSFQNLEDWLEAIKKFTSVDRTAPVHIALIGNKVDLEHLRAVRPDRHENFAHENGLSSHFISAKTGESVQLCFFRIAAEICGVRLTMADVEQQREIVRAEIEIPRMGYQSQVNANNNNSAGNRVASNGSTSSKDVASAPNAAASKACHIL